MRQNVSSLPNSKSRGFVLGPIFHMAFLFAVPLMAGVAVTVYGFNQFETWCIESTCYTYIPNVQRINRCTESFILFWSFLHWFRRLFWKCLIGLLHNPCKVIPNPGETNSRKRRQQQHRNQLQEMNDKQKKTDFGILGSRASTTKPPRAIKYWRQSGCWQGGYRNGRCHEFMWPWVPKSNGVSAISQLNCHFEISTTLEQPLSAYSKTSHDGMTQQGKK